MTVNDVMKAHTIVDIDDYVHVIDGKVVCYKPDTIDFNDEKQVETLFVFVKELFTSDLLGKRHNDKHKGDVRAILTGHKSNVRKTVSFGYISDFPFDLLQKVRDEIYEYERRSGDTLL